jgi:ATP-dependent Clp protease adaptor protein ClpS
MDYATKPATKIIPKVRHPKQYQVLLHNDDFTTKEFVVFALQLVFHKTHDDSTRIMWNAHKNGVGVIDVYSYQVAETKIEQVHALAQKEGYPLMCSMREL